MVLGVSPLEATCRASDFGCVERAETICCERTIEMSEAKERLPEQSNASGCSHGGEQRTEVSARSHEPAKCRKCGGRGWVDGESRLASFVCGLCLGTGLEKDTA